MFSVKHYIYNTDKLIGKGSTGSVYLGTDLKTKLAVAIKIINMKTIDNQVVHFLLDMEKQALQTINCPYVLKALDIVQTQEQCFIITQYCQRGTLQEFIKTTRNKKLEESQAIQILRKLAIALTAIAEHGFIHRDLKTANIMLRGNLDPVIIDFGYCQNKRALKPSRKYNVGSPAYMSPEAYLKSYYSQKSDVWALGIIFHEMITSKVLEQKVQMKKYFADMNNNGKVKLRSQFNFSQKCLQIFQASLKINYLQRISAYNLVQLIFQLQNNTKISRNRKKSQFYLGQLDKMRESQNFIEQNHQNLSARVQRTKSEYFKIRQQQNESKAGHDHFKVNISKNMKKSDNHKVFQNQKSQNKLFQMNDNKQKRNLSYQDLRNSVRNFRKVDHKIDSFISPNHANHALERTVPRVATVKSIEIIKQRHLINSTGTFNFKSENFDTKNRSLSLIKPDMYFPQKIYNRKSTNHNDTSMQNQTKLADQRRNQIMNLSFNYIQAPNQNSYLNQPANLFSSKDIKKTNYQNMYFSRSANSQANQSFQFLNKVQGCLNQKNKMPEQNTKAVEHYNFPRLFQSNDSQQTKTIKISDSIKEKFKFKNRLNNSEQKKTISTLASKNMIDNGNMRKYSNSNSSFSNYNGTTKLNQKFMSINNGLIIKG